MSGPLKHLASIIIDIWGVGELVSIVVKTACGSSFTLSFTSVDVLVIIMLQSLTPPCNNECTKVSHGGSHEAFRNN